MLLSKMVVSTSSAVQTCAGPAAEREEKSDGNGNHRQQQAKQGRGYDPPRLEPISDQGRHIDRSQQPQQYARMPEKSHPIGRVPWVCQTPFEAGGRRMRSAW